MNRRQQLRGVLWVLALAALAVPASQAARAAEPIRTMLHGGWGAELPSEDYLRFVEQAKPDILIIGVFDQRLYATAVRSDAKAKELPPPGKLLVSWKELAERLHKNGIRLVGQMELNCLSDRPADLTQATGWFGYYDKHWDEGLLGRRPTLTAAELLEEPDLDRHADAPKALTDTLAKCGCRVNLRALNACINKPAWRTVQKAMVKAALAHGVDGFMTNRNYVGHCACTHCSAKLRRWLAARYPAEQLRERLGITGLDKHPLCMVGSHRDHDTVPSELVLEKQRFAKHMVKEFFDEVYTEYGRTLKPDLIVSQWNHMAYFDELHLDRGHLPPSTRTGFAHGAADERWGLRSELWGKGESLLWYCNWGTTQNTILDKNYAGDTVLYGKLLRSLAQGRPYVINKYDFYRPRNMMAEAAALGYATNAIATPWQEAEDRAVVLRYFDFLKKHRDFLSGDSQAEVGLVFPRRALHAGDASALEYVEAAGRALIRAHVLFDVLPDDLLDQARLGNYRAVVLAAPEYLEEKERKALAEYVGAGGTLLLTPVSAEDRERPGAAGTAARRQAAAARPLQIPAQTVAGVRTEPGSLWKAVQQVAGTRLSRFEAPWTVEVQAYHQPAAGRLVLHLVNYNHKEKAGGKAIVAQEAPIPAEPVKARLRLPAGLRVKRITFASPDEDQSHTLEFTQQGEVVEFQTPSFLVYGLCVVEGGR